MPANLLLQYFDSLADTPDAVSKLRSLTLDLAVRGGLVPPAPKADADPQWLKFCAEHDGGAAVGPGALPPPPFILPAHWRWARLNDVADYNAVEKVAPQDIEGSEWVLDLEEIEKDTSRILTFVTFKEKQSSSTKARFVAGDVLYGKLRPYLNKVVVAPKPGFCTTEIVPIRSRGIIDPAYLCVYLRTPTFVDYANAKSYGMKMPRLGTDDAENAWVAVPPPGEQRRIVAKVEQLLALCDQLEARQTTAAERRTRLVHSALDHLTAAKDEQDFRIRASFILHNSPFILEDVPALGQAIRSLAIQGKLGTRNPSDEPVDELLKRVMTQKAKAAGKARGSSHLQPLDAQSLAFAQPNGWEWAQAQDMCEPLSLITYGILKPVWVEHGVPTVRVQDMQDGIITVEAVAQCSRERAEKFAKTTLVEGDLLIAKDGATLGKTAFVPIDLAGGNITQHVLRFPISEQVFKPFVRLVIDSPYGQSWMRGETKGVALPGVNVGDFRRMPIPVPPLAEQKRIVAKVEELMRWYDQLETHLVTARTTGAHLLDAALKKLLSPEGNARPCLQEPNQQRTGLLTNARNKV